MKNSARFFISFLFYASIILLSLSSFSCGGGGGGGSSSGSSQSASNRKSGGLIASQGGNNAGKHFGGSSSGSGEASLTINPAQSQTLKALNWSKIDFTIKIGSRAPIVKTVNAGDANTSISLGAADGIVTGETIEIDAKIDTALGEANAYSGKVTLAGGVNNISLSVGRKIELDAAGGTITGGAAYAVLTKSGCTLPAASKNASVFLGWEKIPGDTNFITSLTAADFTTYSGTLKAMFRAPEVGDIICSDRTVVTAGVPLPAGKTAVGIIYNYDGIDAYFISLTERNNMAFNNAQLESNLYDYSESGLSGDFTKEDMEIEYQNIYSTSAAFAYLKTLPNYPAINWYIPLYNELYNHINSNSNINNFNKINASLALLGGTQLSNSTWYMTANLYAMGMDWDMVYYYVPNTTNPLSATTNRKQISSADLTVRACARLTIN